MTKNHFATLGLKAGAGEDEIKKAYRSLAKQWHPDKNKSPGAEEKFKEIGASYEYLQSKDRRELLERELTRKTETTTKTSTQPSTSTGPSTSYQSTSKPAYGWNYKGTEKTPPPKPPPQASTSSTKAGSSKENSKPASDSKKQKSPHWSESFKKKPNGKRDFENKARPNWKAWSSGWEEDDIESPPTTPNYSNAFSSFKAFVDQVNKDYMASFFFGEGLFGDTDPFGGGLGLGQRPRPKPKPTKKRNPNSTAPESGYSGGLDEELLFGSSPNRKDNRTPLTCPTCYKSFPPSKIARHQFYCGKFDAPSDIDDDEVTGANYSDDNDPADYYPYGSKADKDWRSRHEEVLNKIRRDRQAHQAYVNQQATEEHECEWCGRSFNLRALDRHLAVCKEHVLRFGKPMNPGPGFTSMPRRESKTTRAKEYAKKVPRPGRQGHQGNSQSPANTQVTALTTTIHNPPHHHHHHHHQRESDSHSNQKIFDQMLRWELRKKLHGNHPLLTQGKNPQLQTPPRSQETQNRQRKVLHRAASQKSPQHQEQQENHQTPEQTAKARPQTENTNKTDDQKKEETGGIKEEVPKKESGNEKEKS